MTNAKKFLSVGTLILDNHHDMGGGGSGDISKGKYLEDLSCFSRTLFRQNNARKKGF